MVKQRELGKNTGTFVNPIGLGCMGMSDLYGPSDGEEANMKVLNRALELGCHFWDTSDVYGLGGNELLLGKYFAKSGNRSKVFLCTKFGLIRDKHSNKLLGVNGKPEYVRECCENSLERLGVDTIDLYYQHRVDPKTPIEVTVTAMKELIKEGKVRYLGLSECSPEILRRAHSIHPITAVQMEYSPWTLDIENNGLLETARELGVTIVAYAPLGRGFLTGGIKSPGDLTQDDWRRTSPRFFPENFTKNMDLVKEIHQFSKTKNISPSELILAWVIAQGKDFITIPGTKRIKYLEENVKGGQVELSDQDLLALRRIINAAEISGARQNSSQGISSSNSNTQ
ncbi:pyridoxine 4-dehydrogenase [Phascolomyces articulosus]|uniref:Pyridoxine 4-dehydrogenase n=1 Tax=Phascolomyces articulosus TaxID=60185 RepID=A0AAD5K4B6_9FUNG|nr:pyridoxine 4-dehydrogenase [Phascolomyces articulosus]